MRHVVAILLGLTILGESGVALAESASNESTPKQVLYGAGGALSTVVYLPFKAGFCILGGIASAFTAIASTTTAEKVVGASWPGGASSWPGSSATAGGCWWPATGAAPPRLST